MNLEKLQELRDLLERKFSDDVERMTPKDRLTIYLNLMEFFTPKMNRSNYQIEDDQEREIIIKYYDSKSNPELSGTMGEPGEG